MKRIIYSIVAIFSLLPLFTACSSSEAQHEVEEKRLFDINIAGYTIERKEIARGESWGKILNSYGIGSQKLARLDQLTKDICPLRTIRAGKHYTTFTRQDSTSVILDHLVYEKTLVDYVVFSFVGDSVAVREGQREVKIERKKSSATISSSLWGAIMEAKLPYSLAAEMEDIYQWTVDFFGIQQGDSFTVIYDEKFLDTLSVGVGRIWGAKFTHRGKDIYAIPFEQGGKLQYWEADGGSLRKQLLKAPLKFTRISSKFSNARLHPVTKKVRPHHGVDYAAPAGTPVRAVADGVVTVKTRKKADGNILKIKHPGNLSSGYLHLQKFAKGINVGSKVSQGQVIGYVGNTGYSTGPHLDFRLWKGNSAINPLNVPQKPAEPISKDNKERFERVKERIMAELEGEVPDSMKVTNLANF
ncbi:MAG: peptidoglycan DD-metalloendopeptidase family protein [Alistipes sp.]|nr:peptidoglycan DD-metalloendopeptidase family protein [Alistipes sp.]